MSGGEVFSVTVGITGGSAAGEWCLVVEIDNKCCFVRLRGRMQSYSEGFDNRIFRFDNKSLISDNTFVDFDNKKSIFDNKSDLAANLLLNFLIFI